jgi:ribonuclease G
MTKEMVISANRHETKVAILEDDQLVEILFQRSNEYSLAGSIHKGRVTRVLPGMQSAFVDLGLERDTFLYVSDFFEENDEFDSIPVEPLERAPRPEDRRRSEDRGRSEKVSEKISAPEPQPEEAAPPQVAAVAPVPEAGESAPAPPPTAAPPEDGDPKDRRNRRGRRRRNRGRGFPESKYASDGAVFGRGEEPETEAPPVIAAAEAEQALPPLMLPGESISKYQRPLSGSSEKLQNEPKTHDAEPEPPTAQSFVEPVDDEEVIGSLAEPQTGSINTFPALLASDPSAADAIPAPSAVPLALQQTDEQVLPEAPGQVVEPEVAALGDEEAAAETDLAEEAAGELDEENEADEVEDNGEVSEGDAAQEAAEAAISAEEGQSVGPDAASANLREQGGRYMHRVTRRQRRKMRGGSFDREGGSPAGPKHGPAPAHHGSQPGVGRPEAQQRQFREREKPQIASITELLKEGQEILVQIAKEPLGQKGARITSHIALPGRYVVYMPTVEHLGVSRKIGTDEERLRLKRILQTHRVGMPGGFIMRTAGEGKSEEEIASDMTFLVNLWMDIRQKAEKKPAPALIHHDLDIVQRILRDQLTENFKAIWVDNEDLYESVLRFVQRFQPALVPRVKMYTRPAPIFEAFNISNELEKALRPKVWLKSGGYIVINQTEALVAIDVNTGKFVGKSNRLEDTIVKTNTEAVKEIVRQIRLRDLGGIIVVDFIDMDERKNRQKVMQTLEEAMRADRAPNKILQFNDFGLVAITRKRVKQSLERALCSPCPHCEGAGYIKSVQTVVGEILLEAQKIAKAVEGENVILRVHPDVAKVLKSNENQFLEEIEEILKRPVMVKGDPALHHEKFDLA